MVRGLTCTILAVFTCFHVLSTPTAAAAGTCDQTPPPKAVRVSIVDSGADVNLLGIPEYLDRDAHGQATTYDFVRDQPMVTDAYGHGTHVASQIARTLEQSCIPVQLLIARVLDSHGRGSRTRLARAIRWSADQGAEVINLSMTFGTYDAEVDAAVQYAWSRGAVLVAAGGNTGREELLFPAGYLNVIGVAAVDDAGERWPRSTEGPHIDLAAPGVNQSGLLPLAPSTLNPFGFASRINLTGTSQAAAYVSGVAAQVLAEHEDWSNRQIVDYLQAAAGDTWTPLLGHGVLREPSLADPPSNQAGEIEVQLVPPYRYSATVQINGQDYIPDSAGIVRVRNLPAGTYTLTLPQSHADAYFPPLPIVVSPSHTFTVRLFPADFRWRPLT